MARQWGEGTALHQDKVHYKGWFSALFRERYYMKLLYIFVHGAGGWGHYDRINRYIPYWGMLGRNLIAFLNSKGYESYAASVTPTGSIWVRACELYAQLSGSRVDYGRVHSEREGIARFGRDFSSDPLIPEWNEDTRLVLIGHSMGGATVRLLAHLLVYGDPEEREQTPADQISPLFTGGINGRIFSIVTLAAPTNGVSALDMFTDQNFNLNRIRVPLWSRAAMKILSLRLGSARTERTAADSKRISSIDLSLAENEKIATLPDIYYFSMACSCTEKQPDGTQRPIPAKTEFLYYARSLQMGAYTGVTPGGFVIDESWQENDGLVNTVSARAPIGAMQKQFDPDNIEKGIWNVLPDYPGDHMSVQGGLFHRVDMRAFYLSFLHMIRSLPEKC